MPQLVATWHPASGHATLDAVDRRAWRAAGRVDGTPLAGSWSPPAFRLVDRDDAGSPLPVPDVIRTGAPAPVVSARAQEVLAPLWGDAVEWLPVEADAGAWAVANPLAVLEALDPDRTALTRFRSSGRVMSIEAHVFRDVPLPPVFKDVLAPELATFVTGETVAAARAAGLVGLDARPVWPAGAALPDAGTADAEGAGGGSGGRGGTPAEDPGQAVRPGSGAAQPGGYRLTDVGPHTWVAPDRERGAWFALRIPGGWAAGAGGPGADVVLTSSGQASTRLVVRHLPAAGRTPADAAAEVATAGGARLLQPPAAVVLDDHPGARARADRDGVRTSALVVGVGPELLALVADTDDATGQELAMVDALAEQDLRLRWLG